MKQFTQWIFTILFVFVLAGMNAQKQVQPTSSELEIAQFSNQLTTQERQNFERKTTVNVSETETISYSSLTSQRNSNNRPTTYRNSTSFRGNNCGQAQISNGFENGSFIEADGTQLVANDFFVPVNVTQLDANLISANILSQGGLASFDVLFFTDNAGLPDIQVGTTISGLVPTSQDIIGTAFGFDVHNVILNLPTSVSFTGTGDAPERYWLQLIGTPNTAGTQVAWETTTVNQIGASLVFDNENTTEWTPGSADGVFSISGDCVTAGGCLVPENFAATPTNMSVDLTWDAVAGAANGYVVNVFEGGADPMTAMAVYTETIADGTTTMTTATGLMGESLYDAYISADCDGDTSANAMITFSTTVEDAICGNNLLDSGGRAGDYSNDELTTTTIMPENAGDVVTLTFTYVDIESSATGDGTQDGCWDFITIYNGPDTSSPVLAQTLCGEESVSGTVPSVPTSILAVGDSYTSTDASGALTVVFTSDGSVALTGYEASITCMPPPDCVTPDLMIANITETTADFSWSTVDNADNGYILSVFEDGADPMTAVAVYTENIPTGTTMTTATGLMDTTPYDAYITADCDAAGLSGSDLLEFETTFPAPACGGNFYDTGGPNGNFENNESYMTTIAPDNMGDVVTVTFTFVENTEFDILTVDTGDGSGPQVVPEIAVGEDPVSYRSVAVDGALQFEFNSSGVVPNAGWEADILCGPPPACIQPLSFVATNATDTTVMLSWDEVASATTGYVIEVYVSGESPGNGTAVYTNSVPTGTTMDTATGLSEDTNYEAFIFSDCGADGTSDTSRVEFSTLLNPPACNGLFLDSGGNNEGYQNNESITTTITPDIAGDAVTISFTYVDIEASATTDGTQEGCWDFMTIYNGPDATFPVLAMTKCGEESGDGDVPSVAGSLLSVGDSFTSTDASGALTIVFTSDSSVAETGWSADVTCASLSIDEFGSNNFTYYPNPTSGVLNVTAKTTINSLEVVNMLGQRVISHTPNTQNFEMDLSNLAVGQYFLRANIDGVIVTEKIIKE